MTDLNTTTERKEKAEEFSSQYFTKTVTFTIPANDLPVVVSEEEDKQFWKEVEEKKLNKGFLEIDIQPTTWNLFAGKTMPGFAEILTTIYRVIKGLWHQDEIIYLAEEYKIKKIYTWREAREIIKKAILAGELDRMNIGTYVFFVGEGTTDIYRFHAFHLVGGSILKVWVMKMEEGEWCFKGTGLCF